MWFLRSDRQAPSDATFSQTLCGMMQTGSIHQEFSTNLVQSGYMGYRMVGGRVYRQHPPESPMNKKKPEVESVTRWRIWMRWTIGYREDRKQRLVKQPAACLAGFKAAKSEQATPSNQCKAESAAVKLPEKPVIKQSLFPDPDSGYMVLQTQGLLLPDQVDAKYAISPTAVLDPVATAMTAFLSLPAGWHSRPLLRKAMMTEQVHQMRDMVIWFTEGEVNEIAVNPPEC